ncbi:hypothetical protein [Streptomyces sp. NRRL S-337]|uniref:hypothetical protein n=1 Tax=Streptomyces sp. NRRL S-337 TaxID=1463900 RepID=UPI0018FE711E|nr:hypothetical protein [Streptomyces sp. NRRL S-337]
MTVRGHQGILIMMRFLSLKGPFCRNCGTAVLREMTGKTLWQGWWSPFSLVAFTPFTLISNLTVRAKLNKLPPPVPGQPGQQLDPGVPLRRRPAALGALIPLAWVLFLAIQYAIHPADAATSESVTNGAGRPRAALKLGQPSPEAQEVRDNDMKPGKFVITPQRVVMGKPSDLDELDELDEEKKYNGATLAWVYVNAKLVGGDTPLSGPTVTTDRVGLLSEGGRQGTPLTFIEALKSRPADCQPEKINTTWRKGEDHTLCVPFVVPKDRKVTTVTYSRNTLEYSPRLKWTVDS